MKFSEQWLREWVDPKVSTEELAHQLTMAGLEVDAVEPAAPAFTGVVIGEVLEVAPHPDADKLRVCKVAVGSDEPLNIVCGAPNVHEGMRVPTATVGGVLPGNFKIKKAKLRGVPSFGMLCSAKELGLSDAAEGLMELPGDGPVGEDLRSYLGLDDSIIELGLTPNRSDCLGVIGIAREVGVLNREPVRDQSIEEVPAVHDERHGVSVEAPADCPRYVGRVIRDIDNTAETPVWMRERLRRSGIRSLGPVVDVTNYVLLELGQPMHAFDLAKLDGGIRVRRAAEGERLVLLDESEITMDAETLVIADQSRPVALAGIMGGRDTAVGGDTRTIFLESAFFTPESIAGKARQFGLHTDSSHRFERGVSPALQRLAVERATRLLLDVVGGEPGPIVEETGDDHLPKRAPVTLRHARLGKVLGAEVPAAEVGDILERLGMAVEEGHGEWTVTPPPFRFDIEIEEDLIEEVGRVYGYDRLPSAAPRARLSMVPMPEAETPLGRVRTELVARGYQEAITYSFVDPAMQSVIEPDHEDIALANPISSDMGVMRTSLWTGLVQAVRYNQNRQQDRIRLFETGMRFRRESGATLQESVIGGAVTGTVHPEQWGQRPRKVDFFDVKSDVEALLALTGDAGQFRFTADTHPALHPGQTARIIKGDEPIGWLGALHPQVEKDLGLSARVFVFELLEEAVKVGRLPEFSELSRFPAIRRDIAVVVKEGIPAEAIRECVAEAAPDTLQELKLFDVYQGEGIDPGTKSLALGLTLQANSRTLTDAEVDTAIATIVTALTERLGATLRD